MIDTVQAGSWTLARQNLDALRHKPSCGAANDFSVALPESVRPLLPVSGKSVGVAPPWAPPFASTRVPLFALSPNVHGTANSPWFRLRPKQPVGLFIAGHPEESDLIGLEWGRRRSGGVETLANEKVDAVRARIPLLATDPWHFFSTPDLPAKTPGSSVVRVTMQNDADPGAAIVVTAPVTYATRSLGSLIDTVGRRTLVLPSVAPYLPCATHPRLRQGVSEVPDYIVGPRNVSTRANSVSPVAYATSPFAGLLDLYPVTYLPETDLMNPLSDLVVFRVDRRIPGAVLVPVTKTISSS